MSTYDKVLQHLLTAEISDNASSLTDHRGKVIQEIPIGEYKGKSTTLVRFKEYELEDFEDALLELTDRADASPNDYLYDMYVFQQGDNYELCRKDNPSHMYYAPSGCEARSVFVDRGRYSSISFLYVRVPQTFRVKDPNIAKQKSSNIFKFWG